MNRFTREWRPSTTTAESRHLANALVTWRTHRRNNHLWPARCFSFIFSFIYVCFFLLLLLQHFSEELSFFSFFVTSFTSPDLFFQPPASLSSPVFFSGAPWSLTCFSLKKFRVEVHSLEKEVLTVNKMPSRLRRKVHVQPEQLPFWIALSPCFDGS